MRHNENLTLNIFNYLNDSEGSKNNKQQTEELHMLNANEMIQVCQVFESKYGSNNWCLSNLETEDEVQFTKLVVRNLKGYTHTLYATDETIAKVHKDFGIDEDEAFKIIGSTF